MLLPVFARHARVTIPMLYLLLVSAKDVPPVLVLPLTPLFSAVRWRLSAPERPSSTGFPCWPLPPLLPQARLTAVSLDASDLSPVVLPALLVMVASSFPSHSAAFFVVGAATSC